MTHRFAWAVQRAVGKHSGYDWLIQEADCGATVQLSGRRGASMTHIMHLAYYGDPQTHGHNMNDMPEAERLKTFDDMLSEIVNGPQVSLR